MGSPTPTTPQPTSPPAGQSASSGRWAWDPTNEYWYWTDAPVGNENYAAQFGTPREGNAEFNDYWRWVQSQVGKQYVDLTGKAPDWYEKMKAKYGDPFTNKEGAGGLQVNNLWNQSRPGGGGQPGSGGAPTPIAPKTVGDSSFTPAMPRPYVPFGLQGNSAFPSSGGGYGRSVFSFNSENLVPSLEQRRMSVFSSMLGGK